MYSQGAVAGKRRATRIRELQAQDHRRSKSELLIPLEESSRTGGFDGLSPSHFTAPVSSHLDAGDAVRGD